MLNTVYVSEFITYVIVLILHNANVHFCLLFAGIATLYNKRQCVSGSSTPVIVQVVISWIKDFISLLGQFQPNKQEIHLPWIITREDMWDKFLADTDANSDSVTVSLTYFRKIMKDNFPKIKCPKWHAFHKCSICYDLDLALKDSEVKKDRAAVKVLRSLQDQHLRQTADERTKFYNHNTKCVTGGKRGADYAVNYASAIIDGMTQHTTIIPRYPRKPAWMEGQELLDVHCMGTLVKGVGAFMDFQFKNFKNDANALLHTVHLTVLRIQESRQQAGQRMPEVFFIQLDNVGTNKNHHLIAYCSWLVKTGVFMKVKIGFLIAGHTHENIDQMFSRFSIRLRRKECFTLPELIKVAEECFTPVPKCFTTTEIPDIAAWLDGITYAQDRIQNKMKNITHSHQFKIKCGVDGKVLVQCKQYSTSRDWSPEPGVEVLTGLPSASIPTQVQRQPLVPHQTRKEEAQRKKKKGARNNMASLQGSGNEGAPGDTGASAMIDPIEKKRRNHTTALSNLKKTIDLMSTRHLSAWTVSRITWWESFLAEQQLLLDTDLCSDFVPSLMISWQLPGPCRTTTTEEVEDAPVAVAIDERLIDRLNPEHIPILVGEGGRLPSAYERSYSLNDVQVNQLICLEPHVPDPPNPDRPQDVSTPFWIGKTVAFDNEARAFTVHWYGAEEVALTTAVPYWQTLRFQPRYDADSAGRGIASRPKQTVVNVSELGLIAFDFDLKSGTPKHTLKVHTWTLIMEAMGPRIPSTYLEIISPQRKRRAQPGVEVRTRAVEVGEERHGPTGEDACQDAVEQPCTGGQGGAGVDWDMQVDSCSDDEDAAHPAQSGMSGPSTATSTRTHVHRDTDGQLVGNGAPFVPIGEHAVAAQLNRTVGHSTVAVATGGLVVTPNAPLDNVNIGQPVTGSDENEDGPRADNKGCGSRGDSHAAGSAGAVQEDDTINEYGNALRKYVVARRRQDDNARAQKNHIRAMNFVAKLKQKQETEDIDYNMTGERVRPSVDVPEEEHSNATSVGYMSQSLSVGGHRLLIEGDGHHSASEYGFSDTDEEGEAEVVNQEEEMRSAGPTNVEGDEDSAENSDAAAESEGESDDVSR